MRSSIIQDQILSLILKHILHPEPTIAARTTQGSQPAHSDSDFVALKPSYCWALWILVHLVATQFASTFTIKGLQHDKLTIFPSNLGTKGLHSCKEDLEPGKVFVTAICAASRFIKFLCCIHSLQIVWMAEVKEGAEVKTGAAPPLQVVPKTVNSKRPVCEKPQWLLGCTCELSRIWSYCFSFYFAFTRPSFEDNWLHFRGATTQVLHRVSVCECNLLCGAANLAWELIRTEKKREDSEK